MFSSIKSSQLTKVAIFAAFCFIFAFLAINLQNSPSDNSEDRPIAESLHHTMKSGGLGAVSQKNDDVVAAVEAVKSTLEEKTKTKYDSIEVVNYRPQVVAGMNYFVKVKAKIADDVEKIIHLRIWRKLDRTYELSAYELDKTLEGELKYFD